MCGTAQSASGGSRKLEVVETRRGTVMLSGFAKNATEKSTAEAIARKVKGVKSVKNEIAVRP
jgi:hyperosmotically inducible periplasmic protein